MAKEISKWLKWTFFIDFIVYMVFGFLLIFQQTLFFLLIEWPYYNPVIGLIGDPVIGFLLGAAFLAFASSSFDAWKATDWDNVKITVVKKIVWSIFGSFLMFWSLIDRYQLFHSLPLPVPLVGWSFFEILIVFLVAYIVFYIQHEKEKTVSA